MSELFGPGRSSGGFATDVLVRVQCEVDRCAPRVAAELDRRVSDLSLRAPRVRPPFSKPPFNTVVGNRGCCRVGVEGGGQGRDGRHGHQEDGQQYKNQGGYRSQGAMTQNVLAAVRWRSKVPASCRAGQSQLGMTAASRLPPKKLLPGEILSRVACRGFFTSGFLAD